jgi:sugar fermentation stimulation protein A
VEQKTMNFKEPLIAATLVKRYKRFLADVILDNGDTVTAHCANPGAMEGLNTPGIRVWLSKSDNPKRKLAYSWELAEINTYGKTALVGINTMHPNKLAMEAIEQQRIPELSGYTQLKREVPYGKNSRIDILLSTAGAQDCYVEVKNVHLLRHKGLAEFPDSVTKRGTTHLDELTAMVAKGHRAVMFYIIQRDDARQFTIASDKDPVYANTFKEACHSGVEAIAYDCSLSTTAINIANKLKRIDPPPI